MNEAQDQTFAKWIWIRGDIPGAVLLVTLSHNAINTIVNVNAFSFN